MDFDFKDYIESMGFEQAIENDKVFYNSTYDVKIKFIHHNKNVVLTDPKRRMPKLEHPYPVSFKEAEGMLIPYLNMDDGLMKNKNEYTVAGYLTTKNKRGDHVITAYIEIVDVKGEKTIGAFDFVGDKMALADLIEEQTNVIVKFKIHGTFIHNKYVVRLNVIDIWKA